MKFNKDMKQKILAMYSPFFHNYFQSRPGHDIRDIYFQNTTYQQSRQGCS